MRHISLALGSDGIAILTLDNADESQNLVSTSWLNDMEQAIAAISGDTAIQGVILTSAKLGFMAGADLKMIVAAYDWMTARDALDLCGRATRMHRSIETMGKPWVAALNGLALGGGFELALACHRRIIVDDPKAVVGLPEVNVGLLPGSGGTQRLLRLCGAKTALDLLLSGRLLKPAEALPLGAVDEIVAKNGLIDAARAWLASGPSAVRTWDKKGFTLPEAQGLLNPGIADMFTIATASVEKRGRNYPAPAAILSCIFEGTQLPFDGALSVEGKYFAKLLTDPVARNIIRTTFISKAAAEKGLRRPGDYPRSDVKKLGVLGAGMMGSGIALVAAMAGIEVILLDRDMVTAEKGKGYSTKVLDKQVAKGVRTRETADQISARITPTRDFAQLRECEFIIEAVFEDSAIKAQAVRSAEAVIPETAIFATNTSTLPISGLAGASARSAQFIGMHFFSPVDRMGLVEVIRGRQTSDETLARTLDLVTQLRKTPIVVNDSRGFYTSRVFQTLIYEGCAMLQDGVPPAMIENAAVAAGYPVGPLALLDEVSFNLPLTIVDETIREEGSRYVPPVGEVALRRMRDEIGRGGRATGGGFYDYPEGADKSLWPGLAAVFPPRDNHDVEDLKKRFLFVQALETARCLEDGVLDTAVDADLGAIYGWGFPAWTGGTLSYIDTIGVGAFVQEADRMAQLHGARFAPPTLLRDKASRDERFYEREMPKCGDKICAA